MWKPTTSSHVSYTYTPLLSMYIQKRRYLLTAHVTFFALPLHEACTQERTRIETFFTCTVDYKSLPHFFSLPFALSHTLFSLSQRFLLFRWRRGIDCRVFQISITTTSRRLSSTISRARHPNETRILEGSHANLLPILIPRSWRFTTHSTLWNERSKVEKKNRSGKMLTKRSCVELQSRIIAVIIISIGKFYLYSTNEMTFGRFLWKRS